MILPSLQSSQVSRTLVVSTTSPLLRSALYSMGAAASVGTLQSSRTCFFWHRKTVRLSALPVMYHRTLRAKLVLPSANKSLAADQYLERRYWQLRGFRARNCTVRTNGEGTSYFSKMSNGQGAGGRPDPELEGVERKGDERDRDWEPRNGQEDSWQNESQTRSHPDQYMREVRKRKEKENMRFRKDLEEADKYVDEKRARWQQRMDIIRKWIDHDPYEAIFGFSNRLRMGKSIRLYAPFGRVEPQQRPGSVSSKQSSFEQTSSKDQDISRQANKFSPTDPVTKDEKSTISEELFKDSLARNSAPDQVQKATAMSTESKPPELTQDLLRYDPVSNRMVRKNDEAFSHYGQDLDTAIDIPVKPPKRFRGGVLPPTAGIDTSPKPPSVSDVLAELRQYKSQRLPESVDASIKAEEQALQDVKPNNVDNLSTHHVRNEDARVELEQSFSQMHSNEAEETNKSTTDSFSQGNEPQSGTQAPNAERILPIEKSNAHMPSESSTRSDEISYIYRKLHAADGTVGEVAHGTTSDPTHRHFKSSSDLHETESKVGGGISIQSSNLRRLLEIERHREEISKISAELRSLEELLRSTDRDQASRQDRYNTNQTLKRERLEADIARLETEMKASISSVTRAEKSLRGIQNAGKYADVFPLVFGEKPNPKDQHVFQKARDYGVLEREVEAQKTAMLNVEEGPRRTTQVGGTQPKPEAPEFEVTREDQFEHESNDFELAKEIQDIYEKQYGEISAEHPQPLADVDTTPDTDVPGIRSPQAQTVLYTVLSYDPSTSEVTTTSFPGPVSLADKPIPLTVGLSNLSQPSKFLPHLRLLGNHGFTLITSTKNILVLRDIETAAPVADSESHAALQKPNEIINNIQADSSAAPASSNPPEAIPSNSVPSKQTLFSKKISVPTAASAQNDPALSPIAKRTQPVDSGGDQAYSRFTNSFGRQLLRRIISLSVIFAAAAYLVGLGSGMRRIVVSHDEMATRPDRAMQDGRSAREE